MTKAHVHIIPVLQDNYCYIVEGDDKRCIIIDPGQVKPVTAHVEQYGLSPSLILNTHHHADHVAGNAELKSLYHIPVLGPRTEEKMIPHLTGTFEPGDVLSEAGIDLHVIATPGHTMGHVVFYNADNNLLFSGDTLFSMGCGRLLEGSAEDMFKSLGILKSLPPETLIYCGHEYTESNGAFAASLGAENPALKARREEVRKLRLNNRPSLPVALSQELQTNPFLQADDVWQFASLRQRKDSFQ